MALNEYEVNFDMKYSHMVHVKAKNKTEAKQKAFEKFKKIANKRSQFNIWVVEV